MTTHLQKLKRKKHGGGDEKILDPHKTALSYLITYKHTRSTRMRIDSPTCR